MTWTLTIGVNNVKKVVALLGLTVILAGPAAFAVTDAEFRAIERAVSGR